MKSSKSVIIIPAYNEERNIPTIIKEIKNNIENADIIVVDDGSSDETFIAARENGAIAIKHETNKGKGEALKTAFEYIKQKDYDKIILMDADLQFSANEIPKIIIALDNYDFIMGMRDWSKVPFRHVVGNFVWRTLFNLLYGVKLKDTNCGMIGFNKKIIDVLEVGGGYVIENMMLASAIKNKIPIGQVPVEVKYHIVHGLPRGARVVSGVFFYILKEGIKYRLSKFFKKI